MYKSGEDSQMGRSLINSRPEITAAICIEKPVNYPR